MIMIEGRDPKKCYYTKRGGRFCSGDSVVVFDASSPMGGCMQHAGQVCLRAMGRGQDLTTNLLWPVTAVPVDQWDEYERAQREAQEWHR